MNIFEEMRQSVLDGEAKNAIELAKRALDEEMDLEKVMDEGFLAGITEAVNFLRPEIIFCLI